MQQKFKTAFTRAAFILSSVSLAQEAHALIRPDFEIHCQGQRPLSEHQLSIELNLKHKRAHPMAGPKLFGSARIESSDPNFHFEMFPIDVDFYHTAISIKGVGGVTEPLQYVVKTKNKIFYAGMHSEITLEITSYPPISLPVVEVVPLVCNTQDLRL